MRQLHINKKGEKTNESVVFGNGANAITKSLQRSYEAMRDHRASSAVFMTADPTGLEDGLNVFSYVQSAPTTTIDPLGLEGIGCWTYGTCGGAQASVKPSCCKQEFFDCFANCVRAERVDLEKALAVLAGTFAFGTMPKAPSEMRALGTPKGEINPITGQPSRWAGRLGNRFGRKAIRKFGRTAFGKGLGVSTTGALVFVGFYDLGVILRCAAVCVEDPCAY
jgi:RHS repeat-associated protein